MPSFKRYSTPYVGVHYIQGKSAIHRKPEKIFYIRYRIDGKLIEEKAGRQYQNDMTASRASKIRGQRIEKEESSNKEQREAEKAKKKAEGGRWTVSRLWSEYKENKPGLKGLATDENRFEKYIEPEFGSKEPAVLLPLDVDRFANPTKGARTRIRQEFGIGETQPVIPVCGRFALLAV